MSRTKNMAPRSITMIARVMVRVMVAPIKWQNAMFNNYIYFIFHCIITYRINLTILWGIDIIDVSPISQVPEPEASLPK